MIKELLSIITGRVVETTEVVLQPDPDFQSGVFTPEEQAYQNWADFRKAEDQIIAADEIQKQVKARIQGQDKKKEPVVEVSPTTAPVEQKKKAVKTDFPQPSRSDRGQTSEVKTPLSNLEKDLEIARLNLVVAANKVKVKKAQELGAPYAELVQLRQAIDPEELVDVPERMQRQTDTLYQINDYYRRVEQVGKNTIYQAGQQLDRLGETSFPPGDDE